LENKPEWYVLIVRDGAEKPLVYGRDWKYFRVYNRFDEPYVKRVRRRFRMLEYLTESHHFVHIVFTVEHKGSISDCCRRLVTNWNRFRSFLIKRIGSFKYVRVLEPHRDGYPHMHVLLFTKRYVIDQDRLSEWCRRYGLGKIVWIKRYWAGRYYKRLPVSYLSKYLSKQFQRSSWSPSELVFYAMLWKFRIRSYGFSHGFSEIGRSFTSIKWVKYAVTDFNGILRIVRIHFELRLWCNKSLIDDLRYPERPCKVSL